VLRQVHLLASLQAHRRSSQHCGNHHHTPINNIASAAMPVFDLRQPQQSADVQLESAIEPAEEAVIAPVSFVSVVAHDLFCTSHARRRCRQRQASGGDALRTVSRRGAKRPQGGRGRAAVRDHREEIRLAAGNAGVRHPRSASADERGADPPRGGRHRGLYQYAGEIGCARVTPARAAARSRPSRSPKTSRSNGRALSLQRGA